MTSAEIHEGKHVQKIETLLLPSKASETPDLTPGASVNKQQPSITLLEQNSIGLDSDKMDNPSIDISPLPNTYDSNLKLSKKSPIDNKTMDERKESEGMYSGNSSKRIKSPDTRKGEYLKDDEHIETIHEELKENEGPS